jgi:type I restriction enzyme M protein
LAKEKASAGEAAAKAADHSDQSTEVHDLAETLWKAADALRGQVDAAEYKHVVLGLLFLKYISDAFASRRDELKLELERDGITGAQQEKLLENRDEYTAERVFWVPPEARWQNLQNQATRPEIATLIDDAILAVERDNPNLKNKLPRDYARRGIAPEKMTGLINLIANIGFKGSRGKARDMLGRVYEYFLGKFAAAEGKLGGEFYTPRSVVRVLVEMLEPYAGRVYDPACGSGGMFVQSEKFAEAHGGNKTDVSIFGQESNPTTWRLAHMNLAIHGIEANLGPAPADTFLRDAHPDLKADFVLANPPFNVSDWSGQLLRGEKRWAYGDPPVGNANYAWIQHFIHHLAYPNGRGGGQAGFVMANGSLSSNTGGEGDIRRKIVEADLVDCIVAMGDHDGPSNAESPGCAPPADFARSRARSIGHHACCKTARRQDRAEPSDGSEAGGVGAGGVQGVVRGLRAGEGQGRRRDRLPRHAPRNLRHPPHPPRRLRTRFGAGGVGNCPIGRHL